MDESLAAAEDPPSPSRPAAAIAAKRAMVHARRRFPRLSFSMSLARIAVKATLVPAAAPTTFVDKPMRAKYWKAGTVFTSMKPRNQEAKSR